MEANVVAGVEFASTGGEGIPQSGAIHIQLLGPMAIRRAGAALPLPPSRKLRALVAYLALATHPVSRAYLCELLWDLPNDPRGELRWCLSKARALLDDADQRRVQAAQDSVTLDLHDCHVDGVDIEEAMRQGIGNVGVEPLRAMAALFLGEFLEGLHIRSCPMFDSWLVAQRRRFRACQAAVLEHLAALLPDGSEERYDCLDKWLRLAPFDRHAHMLMLQSLSARKQLREGEEHVAAAIRAFEDEGLDWRPLRDAWSQLRRQLGRAPSDPPEPLAGLGRAVLAEQAEGSKDHTGRASIAVMPFADASAPGGVRGGLGDGLAYDIITRLAKLRSLFVIAQGTVFALDQRSVGPEEAGRTLNVDFVVSGLLRRHAKRIVVDVALVEARTARIVWAETFDHPMDDAFVALDDIGNRIVASVDIEIESAERERAILTPPNSLDAWSAHHRGLWHMYRFNRADNARARHFFELALRLDPTYSRAYAGLSFTHWQDAFQRWGEQNSSIDLAYKAAGQSLIADDRDPAAHWAMGRALWLRGSQEPSLSELQRAVDLSPNFALGHYTLGFVHCQSGDAQAAIGSADHSRHLSPFDPLMFGMLAVRALALVRLGRVAEAADWAVKAAMRPNAHVHILAIAAHCLALADRQDEALAFVATIHKANPAYGISNFLDAFRLTPDTQALFKNAARRIGLE
ncbi:transcriptional regulator [Achromobacter sp. ES-001]|uniref:transcriptional regulator n=1 Tax=Achromobacter sp. ES-001 TaxID=2860286 RepID=UPI001C640F73|nr:transcriptional regulator [Achromobacter sp. ES-001]QYJ19200.1 transcriptional regulator [Achromobacter sp. ES-001]